MIRSNDRRYWTTLAILGLTAGAVSAAGAAEPGHADMEVVEVVEKALPTFVSADDYFAPLAEDLSASFSEELRTSLTVSAMTGYQLLAAELEMSTGTRVAADDTDRMPNPDAVTGEAKGT